MATERASPHHPFRFGLVNETPEPKGGLIDHARRVEGLGFSTLLIRDHFLPHDFGHQMGPIATLAAVAAGTERLRMGSLVFDNDHRHPVLLAKEAATIDLLSGGRLELGLGAGWLRAEYQAAGLPYDPNGVRISRLEESITVLKGLFADGPLTFRGRHYQIDGVDGFPRSVQRPHPPILIGAGRPRMLRLAGREADIVNMLSTSVARGVEEDDPRGRLPASVEAKLASIREGAGTRFDQLELSLFPNITITDRRREATLDLIASRGWGGITPEQVWSMPAMLIGSIDQVLEDLETLRQRFGFTYHIFSDRELSTVAPIVERLATAPPADGVGRPQTACSSTLPSSSA
jgi:probable F420-dependent oxidoreductase